MPQRFILKNQHRKVVRPASRYLSANNTVVSNNSENKKVNEETKMNNVEQLKSIIGDDAKLPKRKVKFEKKDKGLIERTEDSTILITEDNKMMLND
jgi:hypothetical protein